MVKQYFPLTDYDFYAYVTSGMLLIASVDYIFGGAVLIHRSEWTIVQMVFWGAISYLLGQIIAGPSSAILEHGVARGLLHSPLSVALGLARPRWRERVTRQLFANREYAPLPAQVQASVLQRAAEALNVQPSEIDDAEAVFGVAFIAARGNIDTAARLDQFRNLYGFSRNISFVAFITFFLLLVRYRHLPAEFDKNLVLASSLVVAVGMFGRFIKFYASYSRTVLTAFSSKSTTGAKEKA